MKIYVFSVTSHVSPLLACGVVPSSQTILRFVFLAKFFKYLHLDAIAQIATGSCSDGLFR